MLFAKEYFKKNLIFLFVSLTDNITVFFESDVPEYFYKIPRDESRRLLQVWNWKPPWHKSVILQLSQFSLLFVPLFHKFPISVLTLLEQYL